SHFIASRLPRINDVTLDFRFHFFFAHAGLVAHVSDCLLARPMFGVNSGINNEPDRAKKLVAQTSEIAKRIVLVPTGLFREPFGIKPPPSGIGGARRSALAARGKTNALSIRLPRYRSSV